MLEARIGAVSKAHSELKDATISCTDIKKQSEQQRDEAKELVTGFQGVSNKSRDVRNALMLFQNDSHSRNSPNIRLRFLRTVVELSRHLLDHDLLARNQKTSTLRLLTEAYDRGVKTLEERHIQVSSPEQNILFLDDF